jgi:hypothetical protein
VNDFIDRASDRPWSSAKTDAALRGSGADGLMNDAYNSYGIELGDLSTGILGTNTESLLRAAGEAEREELKAPDQGEFANEVGIGEVEPYEVGPDLGAPSEGAWERVELNSGLGELGAPLLPGERFVPNAEQVAMGAEMMEALMMDMLGMVPLGAGGLQPFPEEDTTNRDRMYGDFLSARTDRYVEARDAWLGAETYVNIANRWYKAKVKDMYYASPSSPTTKFEVEVEWDDLDGKTMDYVVPASSDRIRLQSDGPPPLREGGITRYEPFTDPQQGFARRHLNDLLPMEQVFVDGKWREVKSVEGNVIKFSDGTTYDSPTWCHQRTL